MLTKFFGDGRPIDSREMPPNTIAVISWKYYEGGKEKEGVAFWVWNGDPKDQLWSVRAGDSEFVLHTRGLCWFFERGAMYNIVDWLFDYFGLEASDSVREQEPYDGVPADTGSI